MIAMVSFVESISIAQATAFQQRSKLNSNQELIALGLANIGAGLSSSFPVTGVYHALWSMPMLVQKHLWQAFYHRYSLLL